MHIKFLAHGTGSGAGAARYLTGKKDHTGQIRKEVRTLRGDPHLVGAVADSLDFQHRYTSGVIAWAPSDAPTDEQISAVLDDFERAAFAGLDRERVSYSAVLHRDHDSVHVHVFVARVDLTTGKSFNAAPPGWEKTFDPLRDYHNFKNSWARPDDIALSRTYQPGKKALMDAAQLREGLKIEPDSKALITEFLEQRIEAGHVKDRASLLDALRDAGLEINRQGKDYISVKDIETNQKIRLKGGIYDQDFTPERALEIADIARSARDRAADERSAKEALGELESAIQRRAKYNTERYKVREPDLNTVAQKGAHTDRATYKPTAEAPDDISALASDSDRSALPVDARVDVAVATDRAIHSADADLAPERREVGDRDRQSGMDDVHERVGSAVAVQNTTITTGGEAKSDGNRATIIRFIESAIGRVREAGAALSAAIERFKLASGGIAHASHAVEEASARLGSGAAKMIENRADELEIFKSRISLTEYAMTLGYAIDVKASSKNSHVMRDGSGDKIVIARGHDGHDMYFSVRSQSDSGTIVDFVQNRLKLNLGQARKELRPWAGLSAAQTVRSRKRAPEAERIERPAPVDRDKASLLAAFHRLTPYTDSYLESERKLAPRTIAAFAPVILQDEHKNACFLHTDSTGDISGWEKKNRNFTGFASGGVKTFFQHMPEAGDLKRLVVTESAIDAMSYYERHGAPGDRYLSCGGALNDQQRAELERIARKAPAVVIATDNDRDGHAMAEMIKSWKPDAVRAVPEHGKDWNDELKNCKSKERARSLSR